MGFQIFPIAGIARLGTEPHADRRLHHADLVGVGVCSCRTMACHPSVQSIAQTFA
jgi:hypothetical protein